MTKLFFAVTAILVLLSGCYAIMPQPAEASQYAPETAAAVTESPLPDAPSKPAQTEEPAVSYEPVQTADTAAPPEKPAVNDKLLSYTNEYIRADAVCPEVSGLLDPILEEDINKEVYEGTKELAEEIEQLAAEETASDTSFSLRSRYVVRRNDGIILSISIYTEYFNGGASESSKMRFVNVKNTEPGQRLTIGDLFTPGSDYKAAINSSINSQIAADPDMSDFMFSGIKSNQEFYITDSELVIAFQQYDIAAGVNGEPEFSIPFSELADILIPEIG